MPMIGAENLVFDGDFPEFGQRFKFAARGGQIEFFVEPDVLRNRGVNQFVQTL